MKIPGVKGSYQLRKIYGGEYWYRYWWDPPTKKMQCRREDPPVEYLPKNKPKKEDPKFTNDLPMSNKVQDITLRQHLEALIEQIHNAKSTDPLGKAFRLKKFASEFLEPLLD